MVVAARLVDWYLVSFVRFVFVFFLNSVAKTVVVTVDYFLRKLDLCSVHI